VVIAALIGVVLIVTGAALLRTRDPKARPENERVWNPIGLVPAALAPETDFHAAPVQQPEPQLGVRSPSPDRREPAPSGARGGQGARTPVARRAQLVKAPGYLSINSSPWARVLVDGRGVGTTPQVKIRVTAGQHHLLLVREGFQSHSAWVTVPAGGTVRLTDITLSKIIR
jgi:hypothetical protein